jgi:recombination protein RecT
MTMTVQQHQNQPPQQLSVAQTITHFSPMIAEALPATITPERFTRLALTTLRKDPALQRCKPESFVGALLTSAALGLEPGVNGESYLVAYKGECTLIVGYQGIAKMFWQHPMAARLSAEYVCANDHFEYRKGTNQFIDHRPAAKDRGPVVAYYAIVGLTNGAEWFDVFTPTQIAALRGPVRKGGIADPEHWMERKTALKQVLKLAPKATVLHQVQAVDEKPGSIRAALTVSAATEQTAPQQDAPADEAPEGVNPDTGEMILDGEIVQPGEDPWHLEGGEQA